MGEEEDEDGDGGMVGVDRGVTYAGQKELSLARRVAVGMDELVATSG